MRDRYVHEHGEFDDLIRIVSENLSISPVLVEKDYWIMHCLFGLQSLNMDFYLKGGTSLSKGHKIIHRFSEDLDILITPPTGMNVATGKNQNKEIHKKSRLKYYDWMSQNIKIPGIPRVERDRAFDDSKFRSGGIRLYYQTKLQINQDIKSGILLELGFDQVSPNEPITISSWAYDFAIQKINVIDNRAINVSCYHPGYTLIEKLQAVSTKFRKQQETGIFSENFMRHYYDIYHLLEVQKVTDFIGTQEYFLHKDRRFGSKDNKNISQNDAFQIRDQTQFQQYKNKYELSKSLYYNDKPEFEEIIDLLQNWGPNL